MGERHEVNVDSLDLEARGVARRDGKVVFIDGALPGERVVAETLRSKPRFDTARTVAILRASSQRAIPRCPHFGFHPGACGGCSMQHLELRAQVALKQRAMEDALWHIGRVRPALVLRPIVGPSWGYRFRARLSVRHVAKKGGVLIGFHERASSYVADMRECAILPQRVSALLLPLRRLIGALSLRDRLPQIELAVGAGRPNGEEEVALVLRVLEAPDAQDIACLQDFEKTHRVQLWLQPGGPQTAAPLAEAPELALDLTEFGVVLAFRPTDFTQVNHRINEVLVRRAVRLLEVEPGDRVVDFFCGLGNFTLPIASRRARVIGVEGNDSLVQRAREAAERNRLQTFASFDTRDLVEWKAADWHALVERLGGIDRVMIDPPREGAIEIARCLAAADPRPRRVVYVSCNPATLARDVAVLVHEGGWRLKSAGVVNMFPHTSHVESVACLVPGA